MGTFQAVAWTMVYHRTPIIFSKQFMAQYVEEELIS